MRYLLITYVKRPTGQMDEMMTVTRNLKSRDLQSANLILDFKKLEVVKGAFQGMVVPKDWDNVVAYYYQHYQSTMDRLFAENGWRIEKIEPNSATNTESVAEPESADHSLE